MVAMADKVVQMTVLLTEGPVAQVVPVEGLADRVEVQEAPAE